MDNLEKVDLFDKIDTVRIDVQATPDSVDHHIIKIAYEPNTSNVDTYYIFTSGERLFSTPMPQKLKGGEDIKDIIKNEIKSYGNIKSVDIEGLLKS